MDIGQSFSPTQGGAQNSQYGGANRVGSGSSPVMDAIKILSFRVPQTLGAGSPVAPGILAGGAAGGGVTPGMGGDNSALIQQWLQRFFGGGLTQAGQVAPNAMPGFGGMAGAPTGDPNAMGAGSSLPGAMPPPQPGRVAIQLPAANRLPQDTFTGQSAPTWGDLGGAQRSIGPAAFRPDLSSPMGGPAMGPETQFGQ